MWTVIPRSSRNARARSWGRLIVLPGRARHVRPGGGTMYTLTASGMTTTTIAHLGKGFSMPAQSVVLGSVGS